MTFASSGTCRIGSVSLRSDDGAGMGRRPPKALLLALRSLLLCTLKNTESVERMMRSGGSASSWAAAKKVVEIETRRLRLSGLLGCDVWSAGAR
jgi:hypothetical protein